MTKKISKVVFIILVVAAFIPLKINAAGGISISPSSLSIEKGASSSFTITFDNMMGDVSISSSNESVATVNKSVSKTGMVEPGIKKSDQITVTGNEVGNAVITIYVSDGATFDEEPFKGKSYTVSVNVTPKPTVAILPGNDDNNNNNNDNNNNNTETTPQPEQLEKSNNNKLKELTSDKGTIVKVDDNNFTLEVTNNISEVTIKATPEDAKAKVLGDGVKKLSVGDNKVEITITSETGEQNKILLLIKRKDGYYIDDLNTVLATSTDNNLSFKIKSDSIITTEQLATIQTSGKTINLDYYNDTNKLMYSWIIDAKSLDQASENFNTNVEFSSKNEEKIKELSQNTSGIITSINSSTKIPKGTKLKVYLGRNYKTGNKVKIYYYDESTKKLNTIEVKVNTEDGYVEFRVDSPGDYYFTKIQDEVSNNTSNDSGILLPVSIGVLVIGLISFLISLIVAKKRKKQQEESIDE